VVLGAVQALLDRHRRAQRAERADKTVLPHDRPVGGAEEVDAAVADAGGVPGQLVERHLPEAPARD
jgi:hypothetical protein